VLARRAATIRDGTALRSWLYGVSYRIAVRAKKTRLKRWEFERPLPDMDTQARGAEAEQNNVEKVQLLLAEIERLPVHYRLPVILHHLEGKTREQTAQVLGWTLGMVKGRLERARTLLRRRLARRGLVLSSGIPTLLLISDALPAAVPAGLVRTTMGMAQTYVATGAAAMSIVTPRVATLAEGMVHSMVLTKIKTVVVLLLAFGLLGTGTTMVGLRHAAVPQAAVADEPAAAQPPIRVRDAQVFSHRGGLIVFVGTEIKKGEKVATDRLVNVPIGGGKTEEYRRLVEGDRVEAGQLVGRLDDRVARADLAIKEKQVSVAQANYIAAKAINEEAQAQFETGKKLHGQGRGAMSIEDLRTRELAAIKYREEVAAKQGEVDLAKLEVNKARTILELHEIRSAVSGVITAIYKYSGEGVRELEPVLAVRITTK
jgi:hypothetical protein